MVANYDLALVGVDMEVGFVVAMDTADPHWVDCVGLGNPDELDNCVAVAVVVVVASVEHAQDTPVGTRVGL